MFQKFTLCITALLIISVAVESFKERACKKKEELWCTNTCKGKMLAMTSCKVVNEEAVSCMCSGNKLFTIPI
uniref:Uncharacterized protein n=1 Tax=Isometrus maculatus TaxID=497827 RepID=A0A0U1S4N3_ISOMC|nr:hypothetical protein [Isometrus maculatus]